MKEKYLITGFSGFASRYFCDYLEQNELNAVIKGIDVHDHDLNFVDYKHLSFDFEKIDLLSTIEIERVIFDFKPNFILHLASYSSVASSWETPSIIFNNNANIFLNILEAIRKLNLDIRILSVGSSEEYGNIREENLPVTEDAPLNPSSPYAVARVSQELLSKVYVKGFELDIVLTRSFNHIGPMQKDIFVIASFAKQLVMIKKSKYSNRNLITGDVSVIRDFCDVRDVATAYYLLLQNGKKGEIYNVCSGIGISLRELISIMADILSINISITIDETLIRPGENRKIIGCNEKIRGSLGWNPQYSLKQSLCDILNYWDKIL
jgi:GDP-4-dehydro-6-deoxy-D-mannose reductase